jgi:DNA-binding MarR family transcriptional regulator
VKKTDYETLAAFRYELRKFLHFSENAAESHGLASQQYLALLAIEGFPSRDFATIGELAERLRIAHHSAVGLVNRLESKKLVKRMPSSDDKRQVFVRLSPRGRNTLEKLAEVHHAELQTVGPLLANLLTQVAAHSRKRK